jgi:membrane protein YqaA with SNARE-associated domain
VAKTRRTDGIALTWGFAEATVFFIVPDVFLSWLALRDYRRALLACLWAVGGALLGGIALWQMGPGEAEAVRAVFVELPGIDTSMLQSVRQQLEANGLIALFFGPLSGTPYKLYALEAGQLGVRWDAFMLVSIPAPGTRRALHSQNQAGAAGCLLGRVLCLVLFCHAVMQSITG